MERNQLLQYLNQLYTETKHFSITQENSPMIPSTSKKVTPQQVKRSEFSIRTPFVFHAMVERQKREFIRDAFSFTENLIYKNFHNVSGFCKTLQGFFSLLLFREHHNS